MDNNTSVLDIYPNYKDFDFDYNFTSQDYFVHMLRFSLAADKLVGKNVLDIGCGKHMNLLKAMCEMKHGPKFKQYVGTDYGPVSLFRKDSAYIWDKSAVMEKTDFTNPDSAAQLLGVVEGRFKGEPYTAVCFEVLEHMDFESQNRFLYNLSWLMRNSECEECWFSTPNFNGKAARNHVSELNFLLLEEMFSRYKLRAKSFQGLSAQLKYCEQENLLPGRNPPNYIDYVPAPLKKMVWAAALPRWYSNNILYKLVLDVGALGTYQQHRGQEFKFGGYRQGASKESECSPEKAGEIERRRECLI